MNEAHGDKPDALLLFRKSKFKAKDRNIKICDKWHILNSQILNINSHNIT